MKILLLTDSDVFAGTERHMLDLAVGLDSLGVEVRVGCPGAAPLGCAVKSVGIDHLAIEKRGAVDWRAARLLARELRAGRIDLIHAHNGRTAYAAALGIWLAGRGRLVMTQHFISPARASRSGLKAVVANAMNGWVAKRLDHMVAISEAVLKGICERGDCRRDRVTVVANGTGEVDVSSLASVRETRGALGVGLDEPVVFCAARHQAEKDLPTLIRAMEDVVKRVPGARCLIAGRGKQTAELEGLIEEKGLGESVTLLGFRDDVPALIAAGDVFALPSLVEAFGLVLIEAMALRKPIAAVAVGGPVEIVDDGVTGYLSAPSDAAGLAESLVKLLSDPAQARAMGEAGYERFQERYTVGQMAKQMHAVYESVMVADRDGQREVHGA